MRIAFNQEAFYMLRYSGIPRYITRLTEELSRLGEEAHIFAPIHRNHFLRDLPSSLVSGWYFDWRPGRHTGSLGRVNKYLAKKRIEKWAPDVVHETYYSDLGTTPPGSRTVVTVYDMIYESVGEMPGALVDHSNPLYIPGKSEAHRVTEEKKKSVRRADHVICISEETRRELIERFEVDESMVSVIYLGVDIETGENNPSSKKMGEKPFLLYVSAARPGYKNFAAVLRAVAFSPILQKDFNIYVFGGEKFCTAEHILMQDLGYVEGQVLHFGGDDLVLKDLYQRAHAFVHPALLEGFGLTALEAMAHSCPVISSNSSVMPEILGNAAEYFDPTDIDDVRRAIEQVAYTTEVRNDLIEKGKERVQRFTWSRCADETRRVYKEITSGNV